MDGRPEYTRDFQLADSVLEPALQCLPLANRAVITHSALRETLPALVELMRDESRRKRWSDTLHVDCAEPRNLGRLLLVDALRSNAEGVVLFSSTDQQSIRANAALTNGTEFSTDQVTEFGRLSREALSCWVTRR